MCDINWPHVSEIITAIFTIVLAIATGMLWWATRLLANKTKEDFTRRKIQDTVAAWSDVRDAVPPGGFENLNPQSKPGEEMVALRKIEYFASCINAGVYDHEIFVRLSGSWFIQQ